MVRFFVGWRKKVRGESAREHYADELLKDLRGIEDCNAGGYDAIRSLRQMMPCNSAGPKGELPNGVQMKLVQRKAA